MNSLESTKLVVVIQEDDKEKPTRLNFANVIPDPSEEKILALGDVMLDLAPVDTLFDSIIKTEQTRYFK